MLALVPFLRRRLEFAAAPCIAVAFWALAVLVHIKLQGGWVEPVALGGMLICCVLALGFVCWRRWTALGMAGMTLLAAIASYLAIASVVSLATGVALLVEDVGRQGFFLLVTLAAILGGRWVLERIGVEALLQWMLLILMGSCVVVLASPLLREVGVLPEYRLPWRLTGTFTDPNDAGFIGCITVALALALQSNGGRRRLAYPGLVLGCAAGLASFSNTAALILGGMLVLFLLLHVRRWRQDWWHTGLTVLCLAGVMFLLVISWQGLLSSEPPPEFKEAVFVDADEAKRVGDTLSVYLVNDADHRADDDPVYPWGWQRANALPDDARTPDDDTWSNIAGVRYWQYITGDDDEGKFLRAYVSYEKYGRIVWVETAPIGPVTDGNIGLAGIHDADEPKRVGETIGVYLVEDKAHRQDDEPTSSWLWERADARPGDVSTPDGATWSKIEGVRPSWKYTPTDDDAGKFIRVSVSYEKHGQQYRAETAVMGPIMAAAAGDAEAPSPGGAAVSTGGAVLPTPVPVAQLEEAGDTVRTIRGEFSDSGEGALTRRTLLWEIGFNKVLDSPIVGNGLYQMHFMESGLIGHHGKPAGVHNLYLMLPGEAGIIPLALYVLALFLMMRLLWTAPKSLGRDAVVGWVIVMGLSSLAFHHLLTMGAYNFVIGLTCAMAAFLAQGQKDATAE